MKIYVASSWRNEKQQEVVKALRDDGHEVYDFKNPAGETGFHWSTIDPDWKNWTPQRFRLALFHPVALQGYQSDRDAMEWCDACVMVMPCGRSAHTEMGWCAGAGKLTLVLLGEELAEPELMYKLATHVCLDMKEILSTLYAYKNIVSLLPERT